MIKAFCNENMKAINPDMRPVLRATNVVLD